MELVKGQKLLVLRYNVKVEPKCIDLHQKVIEQIGYCWFGKIGKIPSAWMLESVFSEKTPAIILFNKSGSYISEVCDFSYEPQYEGIPDYYTKELYGKGIIPESYFKLGNIERIDFSELERFIVLSSNKSLLDTLSGRAMSSFFFVSYGQSSSAISRKIHSDRFDKTERNPGLCKYIKEGICTNHRCINYQYECERPNMCTKQRL